MVYFYIHLHFLSEEAIERRGNNRLTVIMCKSKINQFAHTSIFVADAPDKFNDFSRISVDGDAWEATTSYPT